MMFLGTYGDQLPLYTPECVAQLPLLGNDQIVVGSSEKFFGCSSIKHTSYTSILTYISYTILRKNLPSYFHYR